MTLTSKNLTLYERLGGDNSINMLVTSFLDEIIECPTLVPFFTTTSLAALKTHHIKFFRVIYGKEEEKPDQELLLEFMLKTHSRLFREYGLNETHFDCLIDVCFLQALRGHNVDQHLIEECLEIIRTLRPTFEYGAALAQKEKSMDAEQLKNLPRASAKTIGTDELVCLPEYSKIDIPDWLPEALGKTTGNTDVRAWTASLTDRFGADGDVKVADTFLDQAYMDHHVYLVALLELAFMPDDTKGSRRHKKILKRVRYPRGRQNAPLSRALFDRMAIQVVATCRDEGMASWQVGCVENKLRTCRPDFAKRTHVVGGIDAPHILRKVPASEQVAYDGCERRQMSKNPLSKLDLDCDDSFATQSVSSMGSDPSGYDKKQKLSGPRWSWFHPFKKPSRKAAAA